MINPDDDRPVESSDELSLPEKKSCKDANLTCKMAKKNSFFNWLQNQIVTLAEEQNASIAK